MRLFTRHSIQLAEYYRSNEGITYDIHIKNGYRHTTLDYRAITIHSVLFPETNLVLFWIQNDNRKNFKIKNTNRNYPWFSVKYSDTLTQKLPFVKLSWTVLKFTQNKFYFVRCHVKTKQPRGLRLLRSLAFRKLESWVRIPLKAWTYVYVFLSMYRSLSKELCQISKGSYI